MDYIILSVLSAAFGYYVRCLVSEYRIAKFRRLVNEYSEAVEEERKEAEASIVHAYVKNEGNTYFVYNRADDAFLAQGKTRVDITRTLESLYPSKTIMITKKDFDSLPQDLA